MQFNKFKGLIIAAVAVASTAAIAAPASAATYCNYRTPTTVRYSYTPITYRWFTWTSAPKTTTTVKQPTTTQQAPAQKAPVQQAPAQQTPAPAPAKTEITAPVAGLTAAEQQMLNLVNQERAKAGLQPLKADLELTKVARLKSQDLINKNYFDHNSPTYGSPFDMMKQFGITYRTAGENLAGNQSVEKAHTALMNSQGHRANILNSSFTHIGIGIQNGGNYGMMFTQMFVGR